MTKYLLRIGKSVIYRFICLASLASCISSAWSQHCVTRQRIVKNIKIGGTPTDPRFDALLEFTPAGYNPLDFTKKYPVIIYFPGLGAAKSSSLSMSMAAGDTMACALIYDQPSSLPGKIEARNFKDSVFYNGQWYKFIVISLQFNRYSYPNDFPSADDAEAAINYVFANYRVDPERIYLTGMSTGANIALEYAASSVARAQRVAGISMAPTCSQVGRYPNSATAPANIANGNVATWFIHCTIDGGCSYSLSQTWVDGINSNSPAIPPRFTTLLPFPQTPSCAGFTHDTWTKLYDTAFRVNGTNLYEYMIQFVASSPLPVVFRSFTARLNNGKVYLKWTTALETDGGSLMIEKSGADQRFSTLYIIKTTGNSNTEKTYEFIDDKPLANISYYRIAQTKPDGQKEYFETRRILNRENGKTKLVISPNPFVTRLSAFLNVSRTQKVTISISDLSGRRVYSTNGTYQDGNTEVIINTAHLTKGVYLLKVEGEDFTEIQKIVKQQQ